MVPAFIGRFDASFQRRDREILCNGAKAGRGRFTHLKASPRTFPTVLNWPDIYSFRSVVIGST